MISIEFYKQKIRKYLIISIGYSFYFLTMLFTFFNNDLLNNYPKIYPIFFIKYFGIILCYWGNFLIIFGIIFIKYICHRIKIESNYNTKFPFKEEFNTIFISLFSSIFFINGLGNYYNNLEKRFLIQFSFGFILMLTYFCFVYINLNLPFEEFIGNTTIRIYATLMTTYSVYVIYDTYCCYLCKCYKEPYPSFLGFKIED